MLQTQTSWSFAIARQILLLRPTIYRNCVFLIVLILASGIVGVEKTNAQASCGWKAGEIIVELLCCPGDLEPHTVRIPDCDPAPYWAACAPGMDWPILCGPNVECHWTGTWFLTIVCDDGVPPCCESGS